METEQFNDIVQNRVQNSLDGLVKKATEYAGPTDRLHNFKVAATLGDGENRSQALAGMMKKHTVSVYDMINSGEAYSEEMWDEKIGDHINYLLLLRATIVEDGLVSDQSFVYSETETAVGFDQGPSYAQGFNISKSRDEYFSDTAENGANFQNRREKFVETGDSKYLLRSAILD